MLLSRGISVLLRKATQALFCISLFLFTCATPGLSQKTQPEGSSQPKYDLHTETKTKKAAQHGIREPANDCIGKGA